MSEDIKTLREAAKNLEEWFEHGNVQNLWPREQKALAIICRREIERMEEEGKPRSYTIDESLALSAALEDGWNMALDAVASYLLSWVEHYEKRKRSEKVEALKMVLADLSTLRKPAHD